MDELYKVKEQTDKEKLTNEERLTELQNLKAPIDYVDNNENANANTLITAL